MLGQTKWDQVQAFLGGLLSVFAIFLLWMPVEWMRYAKLIENPQITLLSQIVVTILASFVIWECWSWKLFVWCYERKLRPYSPGESVDDDVDNRIDRLSDIGQRYITKIRKLVWPNEYICRIRFYEGMSTVAIAINAWT